MADDGSKQGPSWPLPRFSFRVDVGDGQPLRFSELSGLDDEVQPVAFRKGDSKVFSPIRMPGLHKLGHVTLKKGVVPRDSPFWAWADEVRSQAGTRRTVVITLIDESSAPVMTWTLSNARPTKVQSTDLESDGNDVAIDTIEMIYETVAVGAL